MYEPKGDDWELLSGELKLVGDEKPWQGWHSDKQQHLSLQWGYIL